MIAALLLALETAYVDVYAHLESADLVRQLRCAAWRRKPTSRSPRGSFTKNASALLSGVQG
jgi:hypothetical protein